MELGPGIQDMLSGINLMTPKDCRQEQNKQKLRMFKYGKEV